MLLQGTCARISNAARISNLPCPHQLQVKGDEDLEVGVPRSTAAGGGGGGLMGAASARRREVVSQVRVHECGG